MPSRQSSAHTPPLRIPQAHRRVLESLQVPGPVLVSLPHACVSRPGTPCSLLSPTYSSEEEYCTAETCCSSNSCMKSQPIEFCPFGKREEAQSCRQPCRTCQRQRNDEDDCKGPCREEATPQVCKGVDASTDTAVRFYIDRHTSSAQIMPLKSQSMPCVTEIVERRTVIMQDSSAQVSSEVPLCRGPRTDALPCPSSGNPDCKSDTRPVTPTQSMSTAAGLGGMRKPCCATSDATFESGQAVQSCAIPNKVTSIANGNFQKLAAAPTCQQDVKQDKKKKCVSKGAVGTEKCCQAKCPANTVECQCRFPPAFSHFMCTGNIGGTCNCAQNK